ncbi:flippase [Candidatus Parcubacteria bacterium]|nr:flippase [Candidatus Parcubacteria bacterium]
MAIDIRKFFFRNIGIRQTVLKNTFWLALSEIITSLLRFFLVIYAARILGAGGYGEFSFALSFVSLFAIFSDLGLSVLIVREFSMGREHEKEYPAVIALKLILSIGVFLLTLAGSFFISPSIAIQKIIWILAVFIFTDGFFTIVYPFIRARQKMEYEALAKIIQTALTVIFGFFILWTAPSPLYFGYSYFLASLIVLAMVVAYFHFFVYPLRLDINITTWKRLLSAAWPLTFGFTGTWIFINIDSAMIGFFGNSSEVGWFNAASRIIFAIILFSAGLVSRSFYPLLSRLFKEGGGKLQQSWDYYAQIMIAVSLPLMAGGWVLAGRIIPFLYGEANYMPSVLAFKMLIVVTGLTLLCYPYSIMLIIAGQQKRNFFAMLAATAINIVLNAPCIPLFGFYGAAFATIISSAVSLCLLITFSIYHTPIKPFNSMLVRYLVISFLASIAMVAVVMFADHYDLHVFLLTSLGAMAYGIAFAALKFFHEKLL